MHEKFNDPVKAVCYLGIGISEDYPDATVDLVFKSETRNHLQRCRVRDAAPILERLCRRFPRASVYYNPDAEDGLIGEIHCHCDDVIKRDCCSHGRYHRPRVFVRLVRQSETDPAIERGLADEAR